MISNKQRREVAARLRACAQDVNGMRDFAMYLSNWVGVEGVADDEGNQFSVAADRRIAERTLEKLADLIDRPTCEDIGDFDHEAFKCSRCGYRVLSLRGIANGSPSDAVLVTPDGFITEFAYCPNCSAEVTDD